MLETWYLFVYRHAVFLPLPEYHTFMTVAWAATVCGFHGDRLIIMGCGMPSSPLYVPDVRQRCWLRWERREGVCVCVCPWGIVITCLTLWVLRCVRPSFTLCVCVCRLVGVCGCSCIGTPKRVLMNRERVADWDAELSFMVGGRNAVGYKHTHTQTHTQRDSDFICILSRNKLPESEIQGSAPRSSVLEQDWVPAHLDLLTFKFPLEM